MNNKRLRLQSAGALVLLLGLLCQTVLAVERPLDRTIHLDIAVDTQLEDALIEWGTKAGMVVMMDSRAVARHLTRRVSGTLKARDALNLLLAGSGLIYTENGDRIRVIPNTVSKLSTTGEARIASSRMAESDFDGDSDAVTDSEPPPRSGALSEVVVTAQKRLERLQDVPISVTAVGGDQLEALKVNSLTDLAGYVPGLSVTSGGSPGYRVIVIHGLSDGYVSDLAGTTVAMYVDDVPVSSSTSDGRGNLFGIDLMPYDLDRVEVLEGPQGTLYGANALAGLIKYVLKQPNLSQFDARAGVDVGYIDHASGGNWGERSALNVPIVQGVLALRLSAFYNKDAGYIFNVGTDSHATNSAEQSGGRAVLLWQLTDNFSLRATALMQNTTTGDQAAVTLNGNTLKPQFGLYTENLHFEEPLRQTTRFYALKADWDLGWLSITNTAGWSSLETSLREDFTVPYAGYTLDPNSINLFELKDRVSKFVDEFRLSSSDKSRLQWLVGGFYSQEHAEEATNWPSFTTSYVLEPDNNLLVTDGRAKHEEWAGFANLTYKLTELFDVGGGARYSVYRNVAYPADSEGLFGSGPELTGRTLPDVGVSTWMADARFHLTKDAMFYLRAATGYRPGSGCPTCGNAKLGIPGIVDPDTTLNYEFGFKGEYLDHRLRFNSSAFYINWYHLQLQALSSTQFPYAANGGDAKSLGVEMEMDYQPIDWLQISGNLTRTRAYMTSVLPAVGLGTGAAVGDQLPGSASWMASLRLDFTKHLDAENSFIGGVAYRYRNRVDGQFPAAGNGPPGFPTAPLGVQNIADLYTGIAMKRATVRLYGKNIFNSHAYTGIMYINDPTAPKYITIQPRTVGLSIDYQF